MAKVPFYRVVIVDAAGKHQIINDFSSLTFGYSLNRSSTAELKVSLTSPKINELTTATLQSWLRVYRWDDPDNDATERLVWYGLLFDPSYTSADISGEITLRYRDLAGILGRRRVEKDYSVTTPTDASQILWDILDTTQSKTSGAVNVGNLGIIQGAAPTSKNRAPKKDLQNRTVLEILEAFSNYIDGVDWEITPTPKIQEIGIFNTYFRGLGELYHKGNVIATPLTYVVDDEGTLLANNLKAVSIDEVGSEYANEITIFGVAVEESQLFSTASNTAQQEAYKLFQDQRQETNVSEQSTLDDKASEELNSSVIVPFNIKATLIPLYGPRFGTFDVGDIFNVRYKHYTFRDFTRQYRLYGLTVSVGSDGVETMQIELNNL